MSGFLSLLKTGRFAKAGNNNEQALRGTALGSLAVAQVEPAGLELARAGLRFGGGCQVIASGIAPVSAIPTTTATLFLYNNEQAGGRIYVVDSLTAILGSGTAAAGNALLYAVSKTETKPTAATNYSSGSLSDGGKTTRAIWATGVTLATQPVWLAAQGMQLAAAANVGQGYGYSPLPSGILLPPGHGLAIAILGGSGTSPLFSVFGTWYELESDLE